jgi:hypothetical protein
MLTVKSPRDDFRRSVRRNRALKSPGGVDSVPLVVIKNLREARLFGEKGR